MRLGSKDFIVSCFPYIGESLDKSCFPYKGSISHASPSEANLQQKLTLCTLDTKVRHQNIGQKRRQTQQAHLFLNIFFKFQFDDRPEREVERLTNFDDSGSFEVAIPGNLHFSPKGHKKSERLRTKRSLRRYSVEIVQCFPLVAAVQRLATILPILSAKLSTSKIRQHSKKELFASYPVRAVD